MDINSLLSPGPPDSKESTPSRAVSRSSSTFGPSVSSPAGAVRPTMNPRKASALSQELHLDRQKSFHSPQSLAHDSRTPLPSLASYNNANSPPFAANSSPSSVSSIVVAAHTRQSPVAASGNNPELLSSPRGYLEKRPRLQTTTSSSQRGQSYDSRTNSSSTATSGMDALAEVASRQRPQSVVSPTSNLGRQPKHQQHRHQLQQRHDRASSTSSSSLSLAAKTSTPRTSLPHTSSHTSTSVDALMPDAPPPPQHAHIASSLSASESRRLAELAAAITSNTFDFSAHLEYVSLLHTGFARHVESGRSAASGYELLDTLKQARNAMDKIFPVGETLWVEWLTDENLLAKTIDDRLTLMELHHRSVQEEPSSAQLWLLYGDYMYYLWSSCSKDDDASSSNSGEEDSNAEGTSFGWSTEDKRIGREVFEWDSMIDVWEQGVARTQWHLNDGNIVWDRYMEILLLDLSRNKTSEKIARIGDKFVDRLTNRAHATWDQTFSAYSTFVSTYFDSANYEEAMISVTKRAARAKKVFELREPYEFRVQQARERMDKQAEWNAYSEYLDWELRMKGVFSRDLINGLYERATTTFATDATLWNDYVEFLIDSSPLSMQSPSTSTNTGNVDEEGLPALDGVLQRATRHCPWSGDLWSQRLLAMEVEGRTFAEIEEVKHKATVSGLVDIRGLEDLMKVYVAWTGYLSRRAFAPDATEDDVDMAEVGIMSSMEHVQKVLEDSKGDEKTPQGDPHFRLERMYIKLLFKKNDQEGSRKFWSDLASRPVLANTFDFWNRYYTWSLLIHERNRHTDVLDGDQDHNKNGHINPNPNQPWREGTQILERALTKLETMDWPEQIIQQYINHCEQHETVLEYRRAMLTARKASKLVTERREREAASWKAQQDQQAQAQAQKAEAQQSQEYQTEQAAESIKRKRESEDLPSGNKKAKQDGEVESTDVNMTETVEEDQPKRDREHTVILVKNLPESATELKVKQFFRDCGTIKSINLVEDPSGTKTATVEFETKEDALYAQTKAAKPFDGQTIDVEFSTGNVLWVANYPPAADEKYIRSLFQSHGEILEVRFPSIKLNTSRRFCYVQFASPVDAQAAANALDGTVLDSKFHLQAKISDPSKRQERTGALHEGREVVVKNVDWSATEDDIRKLLNESLGQDNAIEKVHMPRTLDGRSKGLAFISLSSQELADKAIKKLDNTPFRKRTLKVEKAIEKGKRIVGRIVRGETEDGSERAASTPAEEATTNGDRQDENTAKSARSRTIALLGVPDTVNPARLEAFVAPHGEIRKLTLRTDHAGAIVEFAEEKGAGVAGLALDGAELDGSKLRVGTVEELLKADPIEKVVKPKRGLGFGAGVVSRPKGTGPKARLGVKTQPVTKGDKMDVDTNGDKEKSGAKSNNDFRELFLRGK